MNYQTFQPECTKYSYAAAGMPAQTMVAVSHGGNACADKAGFAIKRMKKRSYLVQGKYDGVMITRRELEMLSYLLSGYALKEIARCENLSVRTVEDHIANVRLKLCFSRKQEMVRELLKQGCLSKFQEILEKS